MNPIRIDGNSLTLEELEQVALKGNSVEFPATLEFKNKILNSRKFLEKTIEKGIPIYGVTTGFGDSCHNQINQKKAEALQRSLIQFHGVGLGNPFSYAQSRATVLCRLNSNIKGYSALTEETLTLLKEILNRDIIPVIPQIGSVGASGDLTPLSYLAAVLTGERKVYYQNQIMNASEAFQKENLSPVTLKAKEGLALMNGTSVMTAVAALAWLKIRRLSDISDFLTAATAEILRGKDVPFRAKVSELKNHPGQIQSAEIVHKIIHESQRIYQYENWVSSMEPLKDNFKKHDVKIQDRYSIRCAPHINGVLRDTLRFSRQWIENEMNSANDNPLIDSEEKCIYNTGNFYGGHIAAACDFLRVALANISDLSDKQAEIVIDGKFNDLTENLAPFSEDHEFEKGLRHGFKAAQISISALCSEIQFLSAPVSIHSRPTESLNQDKVSLGTISARKLDEMTELVAFQFSIHLAAVCQAMDLAGLDGFSPFSLKIYHAVREISPFVENDRPLDEEISKIRAFLFETSLFSLSESSKI